MKKLLALVLALSLILSFAACGKKPVSDEPVSGDPVIEEPEVTPEVEEPKEEPKEEPSKEEQPAEKPAEQPAEKPAEQPAEKPVEKPAEQPAEKPAEQPAEKPVEKPVEKPAAPTPALPQEPSPNATVGQKLLTRFKQVATNRSPEEIAQLMIEGDALPFMAGAMPVEEGFLNGFNEEVSGFSEGAMFAPMIGTIPFVGYVFKLPAGADVNAFINGLKANGNLRWNICTSAEEMVTGNVGQTVFFVMCPAQFEE